MTGLEPCISEPKSGVATIAPHYNKYLFSSLFWSTNSAHELAVKVVEFCLL